MRKLTKKTTTAERTIGSQREIIETIASPLEN
jgi:hypothetical protein